MSARKQTALARALEPAKANFSPGERVLFGLRNRADNDNDERAEKTPSWCNRLFTVRYVVHCERGNTQHGSTPELALSEREAIDLAMERLQAVHSGRVVVVGAREVG